MWPMKGPPDVPADAARAARAPRSPRPGTQRLLWNGFRRLRGEAAAFPAGNGPGRHREEPRARGWSGRRASVSPPVPPSPSVSKPRPRVNYSRWLINVRERPVSAEGAGGSPPSADNAPGAAGIPARRGGSRAQSAGGAGFGERGKNAPKHGKSRNPARRQRGVGAAAAPRAPGIRGASPGAPPGAGKVTELGPFRAKAGRSGVGGGDGNELSAASGKRRGTGTPPEPPDLGRAGRGR